MDSQPGLARPREQNCCSLSDLEHARKDGSFKVCSVIIKLGDQDLGVVLAAFFVQCGVKIPPNAQ
jgi:hypothetical protein